ncbi:unnamed protein product [Adineta ricciae]|uniref:Apple domain-containing protein n=2 Tax=Adineta ricciae TaxID=249248 RepID=A0A815QSM8_ADIRI|nr:unnamed protein product [Adineta ricciae]
MSRCYLLLIYFIITITQKFAQSDPNLRESSFYLSQIGLEFLPSNEQALFLVNTTASSTITCAQKCMTTKYCRTFNYDIQTKYCRLYQGDVDTTGLIISSSPSSQSLYGSVQLNIKDFLNYGYACSMCDNNRYMKCINNSCQCEMNTYYDGSICRSQKLDGALCQNNIECRNDLNLKCLMNIECGYNYILNYTTSTTASSSSSSTSSTTTTTTTRMSCNSSCTNQTWSSTTNCLASFPLTSSEKYSPKREELNMHEQKSNETFSLSIKQHFIEYNLVIWFYEQNHSKSEDDENKFAQLENIANDVYTFTNLDECIDFVTDIVYRKMFIILPDIMSQQLVPVIHDISLIDSIYIFCDGETLHNGWSDSWKKIKGFYTQMTFICEAIQLSDKLSNQNDIPISIINFERDHYNYDLDQLEPSFMYTRLLKEILLETDHDEQAINDLVQLWRKQYVGNTHRLNDIADFERNYSPNASIWWYTKDPLIYHMLNLSLRTLDVNIILKMSFILCDLHSQIEILYRKQIVQCHKNTFMVYRGQGLSRNDFERLQKNFGGLMSFNNFLSTSTDKDISLIFAESINKNMDVVGVLFQMTIDPNIPSSPFASIKEVSCFNEDEILFSMHTVFRIENIQRIDSTDSLYQVDLTLTSDEDLQLQRLTEHLRKKEVARGSGRLRLGSLMQCMGQFDEAEKLYDVTLERTIDDETKSYIYLQLGEVKRNQGKNDEALLFYDKSLEIQQRTLVTDHILLITTHSSIGLVHDHMASYSTALQSYEKALQVMRENLFNPNSHMWATIHNNIAMLYERMGNYSKAVQFHRDAIQIGKKTFPLNHPHLAYFYNNASVTYTNMGHYKKALELCQKSVKIREATLPQNHPNLAIAYSNIGRIFGHLGENSKALEYFKKALQIVEVPLTSNPYFLAMIYINFGHVYTNMGHYFEALRYHSRSLQKLEEVLPSNHPDLAIACNNIGNVHWYLGEYSEALCSHNKALQIRKIVLTPNHPDLGTSYNCIGVIYNELGDYHKALESYNKALQIRETLPNGNQVSLANTYNNIALLYGKTGNFCKAFEYFDKALAIDIKHLPPKHPDLVVTYDNIGSICKDNGDYERSLEFYQKALKIREETLSSYHPDLALSYNNIALLYDNMGHYWKALELYDKSLQIQEIVFPPSHPSLATCYNNMGLTYQNMGEYYKALQFYEKGLRIRQIALPENHPDLANSYNNVGTVYANLNIYCSALEFHNKALRIRENILPWNHFLLINTYRNIGMVYFSMGNYSKALFFLEKLLAALNSSFSPTHPEIMATMIFTEQIKQKL